MGFRKVPTIYTLEFDGEYEGLVVRMQSTSFGNVRRLFRLLNDENAAELEAIEGIVKLLADHIVSWNMESEEGHPVAADEAGLDAQDFPFIMDLSNRYLDQVTGPDAKLGKDSTDGAKFPGQPLTMEAL